MHGSALFVARIVNRTATASTGAKISSFSFAFTAGRSAVVPATAFLRNSSTLAASATASARAVASSFSAAASSFRRTGRSPCFTPANTACIA